MRSMKTSLERRAAESVPDEAQAGCDRARDGGLQRVPIRVPTHAGWFPNGATMSMPGRGARASSASYRQSGARRAVLTA